MESTNNNVQFGLTSYPLPGLNGHVPSAKTHWKWNMLILYNELKFDMHEKFPSPKNAWSHKGMQGLLSVQRLWHFLFKQFDKVSF